MYKKCLICGKDYKPNSNVQRFCTPCGEIRKCEKQKEYMKRYRQEHKGQPYDALYYRKHRERILQLSKERRGRLKAEVLTYYGKGRLACALCGFSDIRALTIDHIKGDGYKHRQMLGWRSSGNCFYFDLKQQGYPGGYQTLCCNCQSIKQVEQRQWGGRYPACKKALGGKE